MSGTLDVKRIQHLLIDLDGVLYRGTTVIEPAPRFIWWLREREIGYRLVTNNATLSPEHYRAKLATMGIDVEAGEIFTSSLATAHYLLEKGATGQTAYVIGEEGLERALTDIGMILTCDHPDWVIVGLDRHVTYEKLSIASLALQQGAHFVGTNPDKSFPNEQGLVPGAGALQAVLTATTGVEPIVIGKPEPFMLRLAMEALGGTIENTAMLGDRLDTDILGAERLDMPSILVLTGVSARNQIGPSGVHPSLVVNSLAELMSAWG
jgi:4-nitrophenyl phosphatase